MISGLISLLMFTPVLPVTQEVIEKQAATCGLQLAPYERPYGKSPMPDVAIAFKDGVPVVTIIRNVQGVACLIGWLKSNAGTYIIARENNEN